MSRPKLFNEFQEVSSKAWKQQIQFDLKGADYNETLVWESPEGIKVKPFYHADEIGEHIEAPQPMGSMWKITQHIYAKNATMANAKALEALKKGAESLLFTVASEDIKIERLLKDIPLEATVIHFDFQFLSASYTQELFSFVGNKTHRIYLNLDLIGHLAKSGNWYHDLKKDHEILEKVFTLDHANNFNNILAIDASLYQNAGANMVQQLAYALSHANEYLNHFTRDPENNIEGITFKMAVGTNYFFEIAKLRAMRLLWKTLANEYDLEVPCHILALPTKRNKTLYDYNVNMLRTTTECMSAILGGADSICNLPYDALYHKSNEFGERIARNQLLILKHESYFDQVANPADGAYYIESLTTQLAEKALELFKTLEAGGGFLKQLKEHSIQKKLKESAQKEQEHFNTQKEVLVGTNKYLNKEDRMKDNMEIFPFVKTDARKTLLEPIIEKRLSEAIEQKRLKDE
ncbi:methylmalonyl-CoA mutase subunit beta [Sediminicola sp. 1XM1-17]|uniref:methylmalonyl-CoA mutase subunit beta n=1 Tax=Sediminicola sp. 1XM1-17 TaxID=3127702 RepID=UPI0030789C7B